ncbi:hypothetical protein WA026_015596 [Henosepilachna vigintioctopunctata]|uniref:Odorant receptor n=1 Tax=Henosepilachna vigintioctopunctata TaxID=420089 RepID=A0AAW1VG38_9CUCU
MENSELFTHLKKIFLYFGVWKSKEINGIKGKLYDIYALYLKLAVILAAASFICNVFNANKLSRSGFANYGGWVSTTSVTAIKILICQTHNIPDRFENIFQKEAEMYNTNDEQLRRLHKSITGPILKAFLSFFFFVQATNVLILCLCAYFYYIYWIEKLTLHPFEMFLPFDRDKTYEFSLVIYVLSETATGSMAYVMDMTLLVFVIYYILKLKTLQQILKHYTYYLSKDKNMEGSNFGFKFRYADTREFWRSCIFEHQNIIAEVGILDKDMSKLFFIDFFLRTLQMAGFCLGCITAEEFMHKLFGLGCVLCSSSQLIILYWYGQVLASESLAVSDAIYESKWYEADVEIQRILLMMMRRSQKWLSLKLGKFDEVTLRTVLKVS